MCYFFKGLVVDDADDYDHMIYDENDDVVDDIDYNYYSLLFSLFLR